MARDLIDLHIHVGGAVAPHILWSIAHQQGFKLPFKNYWEFKETITARPESVKSLDDYIAILHQWTEKIQSSPAAIERSIYEIIGKEYRGSRVNQIELRFNPMKRNLGGERDLDHIIHAAIRGMDRACLEYDCQAGLNLLPRPRVRPRTSTRSLLEKAIKYRNRGVIGIDLAGTEQDRPRIAPERALLLCRALPPREGGGPRDDGAHRRDRAGTGACGGRSPRWSSISAPDRIGHGIRAAQDPAVMVYCCTSVRPFSSCVPLPTYGPTPWVPGRRCAMWSSASSAPA